MMNKKGFTLVELMVVIVIIGVLAAVAIPKFSAATAKAKASEFPSVLSNIVSAQETNFAETDAYKNCSNKTALKDSLGVDIDHSKYFNYSSITGGAAGAYVYTAFAELTVKVSSDATSGLTAYVDETNGKDGSTALKNLAQSYFK